MACTLKLHLKNVGSLDQAFETYFVQTFFGSVIRYLGGISIDGCSVLVYLRPKAVLREYILNAVDKSMISSQSLGQSWKDSGMLQRLLGRYSRYSSL